MINLKEDFNNFLFYIEKVRGYSPNSIATYNNTYKEEEIILDITPLRLKNINNSKKTISKKLSAIRSFVKYTIEQEKQVIKLVGNSIIKVPNVSNR